MRTCGIVDFAVLADYWVKLKESDLARNKKNWNMKEMIIPIVIGALGTVSKGVIQGLKDLEITGRVETNQTTALLRSARIPRRVQETWGHSNFNEKPSANTYMNNSQGVKIIIKFFYSVFNFNRQNIKKKINISFPFTQLCHLVI